MFFDHLDDVGGYYPNMSDLGNPTAVVMSNRSLEELNAVSGKERDLAALIETYGTDSYIGLDGNLYSSLQGFETNMPRGDLENKDKYIITTFYISYIIDVGLKCPQFR